MDDPDVTPLYEASDEQLWQEICRRNASVVLLTEARMFDASDEGTVLACSHHGSYAVCAGMTFMAAKRFDTREELR